jgi:hypothetical protein
MRRFTQSKMNSVKAVCREARVIVEGADGHADDAEIHGTGTPQIVQKARW